MSILVGVIINRVLTTLIDSGSSANSYWTTAELIDYLNASMAEAVSLKPDISTAITDVPLIAGINQTLPDGAVQFLEAYYNTVSGNGIYIRNVEELQHSNPAWAAASIRQKDAIGVFPDLRNPRGFRTYPGNDGTGSLNCLYSVNPPVVAAVSDTFPLPAAYQMPMWAGVLAQAYAKNTVRGDLNKTKDFYSMFVNSLTNNTQIDATDAPQNELTKQKSN